MQPSTARVPEAQYEAIQNFITNSPWDWRESQGRLLDLMAHELGSPRGILILDDVPLVKKGRKSPGVSRQYCGVSGTVDNCQLCTLRPIEADRAGQPWTDPGLTSS